MGNIAEDDIRFAMSDPTTQVIGFNVTADASIQKLAGQHDVSLHTFSTIYEVTQYLETLLEQKTKGVKLENKTGNAKVIRMFEDQGDTRIIGAEIEDGTFSVGQQILIKRKDTTVGTFEIREIQQRNEKKGAG